MGGRCNILILIPALFAALFYMKSAYSDTETILVANNTDRILNQNFIDYLEGEGVQVRVVHPKDFSSVRKSERIIVIGSPDGEEGIGEIVREILIEDDDEMHLSLIRNNAKTISFVKYDIWKRGQLIFLLSGLESEEISNLAIREKELVLAALPFVEKPNVMSLSAFKKRFDRSDPPVILDVRTEEEYGDMHFRDVIFIPHTKI